MDVLIYGLQRSGTNYLEALLRRYRVRVVNDAENRRSPHHKHFRLYGEKSKIPEPQYDNDLTFDGFSEFEATAPADQYLVISKDPYSWLLSYRKWAEQCGWPKRNHHYSEEWALFYGEWLRFARQSDRIHLIRYVDLLQSPALQLPRKRLAWPFRIRQVAQSASFAEDRKRYYTEERYISEVDPSEVNKHVPPEIIEGLGYRVVQ